MKPVGRYELAQAWATGGEFPQNLAERFGIEFHLGDSGAFSGDAQKFNVHVWQTEPASPKPERRGRG